MTASILVVGAGVAGHALARALAQRNLACDLIDQRTEIADQLGLGLNLPGNAVRALAALGVADEVRRHGAPVNRREYRNACGRLLFATDDARFWRGVGQPVCVRRSDLLQALRGGSLHAAAYETQAVSVRTLHDRVEVQIDGEERSRRYDFVVGADGLGSVVRSAIASGVVRPSLMTQSSWRLTGPNPGVDCWTAWSGASATFLLIPLDHAEVYGYAARTRGLEAGHDPNWLQQAFDQFPAPVTAIIHSVLSGVGELHYSPVSEVRLPRWQRDRLVLIGDAAHATGPVWAQGAAMALEDALVLADLLSRRRDWSEVGTSFERIRRPRVDHVQAATDAMSRLARRPGWLREFGAPVLGPRAYRKAYRPLRTDLERPAPE